MKTTMMKTRLETATADDMWRRLAIATDDDILRRLQLVNEHVDITLFIQRGMVTSHVIVTSH